MERVKNQLKWILTERPNKKYQIYDRITLEESDAASNMGLKVLPEKLFYETNRKDKGPNKRIYQAKFRDYTSDKKIKVSIISDQDLEECGRNDFGYYHIAGIQVLVKWLGCAGTNIPVQIAIRDERLKDPTESIIKLWSGNLFEGIIYIWRILL